MKKEISNHAAAAKMIRAELKKNNIAASVTCKSYTGGSSVDVVIKQDLTPAAVKQINDFVNKFQYGHFDGMTDCYEYSNTNADLPQVKFTFVRVEYSNEMRAAAKAYIDNISGIDQWEKDRYQYMALNGSWGDFWKTHKPRQQIKHA